MKKKHMTLFLCLLLAAGCARKTETPEEPVSTPTAAPSAVPSEEPEITPEPVESEEPVKEKEMCGMSFRIYMRENGSRGLFVFELLEENDSYYLSETQQSQTETEVTAEEMQKLRDMLKEVRIDRFDGFNAVSSDFGEMSGDYEITVKYDDGSTVHSSASGPSVPDEWRDVYPELFSYLHGLIKAGDNEENGFSADAVREAAGEHEVLAAALISNRFDGAYRDIDELLPENGYGARFPFLYTIEKDRYIDAGGNDLFCLMPSDDQAVLRISVIDEENEPVKTLYEKKGSEPVFLKCDAGIDSFSILVEVTAPQDSCSWYPIVDGKELMMPNGGGMYLFDLNFGS
ncbi:MAG: hypothetical protein K6A40_01195 [Solobacterium sp.]|nr:hypothetical protein [Solobacterium sp.]